MDAITLLTQAGWYPGRRVDATEALSRLEGAGYAVSDAAVEFLREYGELTIASPTNPNELWIDGAYAAEDIVPEWCQAYEREANLALTPVGGYSHMMLFVDDQGSLWGGFDYDFGLLAGSTEEVVRVLLIGPPAGRLNRQVPREDFEDG